LYLPDKLKKKYLQYSVSRNETFPNIIEDIKNLDNGSLIILNMILGFLTSEPSQRMSEKSYSDLKKNLINYFREKNINNISLFYNNLRASFISSKEFDNMPHDDLNSVVIGVMANLLECFSYYRLVEFFELHLPEKIRSDNERINRILHSDWRSPKNMPTEILNILRQLPNGNQIIKGMIPSILTSEPSQRRSKNEFKEKLKIFKELIDEGKFKTEISQTPISSEILKHSSEVLDIVKDIKTNTEEIKFKTNRIILSYFLGLNINKLITFIFNPKK